MSLVSLASNLASTGLGTAEVFSNPEEAIGTLTYPNDKSVKLATQTINGRLWNQDPGYAFRIVKVQTASFEGNDFLSGVLGNSASFFKPISDFTLQINPQQIEQDEPFSDTITPTQTGIIVEHEGFVTKRITISGTTGVHPKRGNTPVKNTGQPFSGSGKSGYQEYLELLNWVRSYKQFKRKPEAKDLRMIFLNYKDNEQWFVEINRFSGRRAAPQSTLYNYTIEMTVLGKGTPPSITGGVFETLDKIDGIIDKATSAIDTATSVINSFVDLGRAIEGELTDTIIRPLGEIRDGLDAIGSAAENEFGAKFPRKFVENLLNEVIAVRDNAADLFGIGDSDYDAIAGRTNTSVSGEEAILPQPPTSSQIQFISALYDTESSLYKILSNEEIFQTSYEDKLSTKQTDTFQDQINFITPTSTKQITVPHNVTLEDLAASELGDASKWVDIKLLNNLEYPYIATKEEIEQLTGKTETITQITEDGNIDNIQVNKRLRPNVLRPGDKILIPLYGGFINNNTNELGIFRSSFLDSRTQNLNSQELMMGVDIKLNNDRDIIINNRNDAELIVGYHNAIQSLGTKLGVEKGEYKLATEFGIGIVIGNDIRITPNILKQAIIDAITTDPRYEDVKIKTLRRVGVSFELDLDVILVNDNQPIPLTVPVSG